MGRFTLGGSVSRQATRYDEADTFVSSERQKTHTNEASLNIQVEAIKNKYTGTIAPYLNMKTFESTSHSNVNLTATGRALLLQNQSTSYGMIGGLQLNDTSNSNALAAETVGNGVLLESQ